jgi:3-oxoacyl-[acyl-carrier protein] reductase
LQNKDPIDQCVLITGGGSGIGKAFANALLAAGFGTVLIASRRKSILDLTSQELRTRYPRQRILSFAFDLRDRSQTEDLVQFAMERCGAIDVLINNSGLAVPESVETISAEGWSTVLDTNLRGAMWLTQLLLPKMADQNFGDIVNISSQAGKNGYADVPAYCASKYGLLGFADALRDDVCRRKLNVRIFNFCPALVEVERDVESEPRPGFLHVRAMTQTLLFALQLDRNVILHDVGIAAR